MLNSTAGDADATCRRLLAKRAFKCSMPQSQDPPRTEVVFALTVDLWVCIVSKLLPHERAALCHTCSTSRAAVFEHAALAPDGAARFAKEQADAWAKAAVLGGSIFVTGGAGTGKTHVTRQIVEAALERDEFDAKVEAEAARAWAELQQRQKAEAFSAVERLKLQVDEDSRSEFHDAERFLQEVDNESPCDTYEERQPSIAVVTPTGAAARVASTSNLRAFTVHRLFNIRAVKREPGSEPVVVDPGHENDARVDDESDAHMDEADTADDSEEDTDPGCLPTCVLDKYTRGVLRALRTLVIDEVSMLDSDMLETIDCALRHATGCSSPFGGVQVVAVGDFYQLAPVTKGSDRIKWAFTSPLWRALTPVSLTEVHRQKNARFASFLNRVRDGSATQADVNWFTYRAVGAGTAPLTIMPFNKRCNDVNDRALDRVTGSVITLEPHCFCQVMFPGGPVRIPDQQLPRTPIYSKKATAKTVGVKVGGRVRVTRNVYEGTYPHRTILAANGQRGTLVGIEDAVVVVDLDAVTPGDSAERVELKRVAHRRVQRFRLPEEGKKGSKVRALTFQFPITNAFAITTHSSQGGSVHTRIDLDLNPCLFNRATGEWLPIKASVYVSLSRATAVENIRALGRGLQLKNIGVHPEVREYYRSI